MLLPVSRGGLRPARLTGGQALIVEAERAAAAANDRLGTYPGTVLFRLLLLTWLRARNGLRG
jgi:hypothetical protein